MRSRRAVTAFFILGFVFAGAIHLFDRLLIGRMTAGEFAGHSALAGFASTLMFTLNLAIYIFLLVWWLASLHSRLLPSRARTYLILAAGFMLFFLFERAVKYRVSAYGTPLEHALWYAFYVPLAMIPTLFLLTCLSIRKKEGGALARHIVWAIADSVVLIVATNDFHLLMFAPKYDLIQNGSWTTYDERPFWYVFYGYVILCILAGIVLLAIGDRRQKRSRRVILPIVLILVFVGMMQLAEKLWGLFGLQSPWAFPEAAVFGMLAIFESCIRSRLIPHNDNYIGFFENLRLPAVITDRSLTPVFHTASPVEADKEALSGALAEPRELGDDKVLYGTTVSGGYAFRVSDESLIRRLNERLEDVAETLESENDLLRFENAQKEARAKVDARNRVYSRAAGEVYATQKKIAALLDSAEKTDEDRSAYLAKILTLGAYVKRKTNFVLLASERECVTADELFLALDESARFFSLCGVNAVATTSARREFTAKEAASLYDSFEMMIEGMIDSGEKLPDDLLATLSDGGARVISDVGIPLPENMPCDADVSTEDGQYIIALTVRKEAAR